MVDNPFFWMACEKVTLKTYMSCVLQTCDVLKFFDAKVVVILFKPLKPWESKMPPFQGKIRPS